MSLLLIDLTYLGVKTIISISRYIGVATYNIVAIASGNDTIYFFPKTDTQLLIEEIKDLKKELRDLKCIISYQHPDIDYIAVEEINEEIDEDTKSKENDKNNINLLDFPKIKNN